MRGLILAAGRGTRMGSETAARPKAMLVVGGRPLIDWQLEALRGAGIDEIAVVRGYRGAELAWDGPCFENPRWAETSIAASLACAERWLAGGPTVVSYADIVYPADAVRSLVRAPGDLAITYDTRWLALWSRRFEDALSDAEALQLDADGRVRAIGGRARRVEDVAGQYMGLFKLSRAGAARLLARLRALPAAEADRVDMTALFDLLLRDGEVLRGVPFDGWWCEVDRPADLALAQEIVGRADAR